MESEQQEEHMEYLPQHGQDIDLPKVVEATNTSYFYITTTTTDTDD